MFRNHSACCCSVFLNRFCSYHLLIPHSASIPGISHSQSVPCGGGVRRLSRAGRAPLSFVSVSASDFAAALLCISPGHVDPTPWPSCLVRCCRKAQARPIFFPLVECLAWSTCGEGGEEFPEFQKLNQGNASEWRVFGIKCPWNKMCSFLLSEEFFGLRLTLLLCHSWLSSRGDSRHPRVGAACLLYPLASS